ncbi:DMT family transporter [Dokdonella sp.]|uniref:DMT family transporter n=1 Tax=Dokdonella sp. TaxID=2291710 RepID=UPI002F3F49B6
MDIRTRPTLAALPLLAAGATIFIWSSAFPAISYGLQAFAPAELALLRFLVASAIFAVPVAAGWIALPPRRDWPAVVALALLGMTVYQLSLGYAMTRVPAGSAAVIVSIAPGVVAALAALRLGEVLGGRMLVGLAIAFVGAVFVTFGSGRVIRFEPMALLVLVAVLATSIYFVFQKPLLQRTTPIGFTAASIFVGTIGLLPFGLHLPEKLALASGAQLTSAIWLGVGPTVLGYIAWSFALSRAPVSIVSSFLYAQPLIAGVIAWLWLGQTMGALAIAGGALTLVGVVLSVRGAPAAAAVPPRRSALVRTCTALWHGVQVQIR